jgi:hypothetical protein
VVYCLKRLPLNRASQAAMTLKSAGIGKDNGSSGSHLALFTTERRRGPAADGGNSENLLNP